MKPAKMDAKARRQYAACLTMMRNSAAEGATAAVAHKDFLRERHTKQSFYWAMQANWQLSMAMGRLGYGYALAGD